MAEAFAPPNVGAGVHFVSQRPAPLFVAGHKLFYTHRCLPTAESGGQLAICDPSLRRAWADGRRVRRLPNRGSFRGPNFTGLSLWLRCGDLCFDFLRRGCIKPTNESREVPVLSADTGACSRRPNLDRSYPTAMRDVGGLISRRRMTEAKDVAALAKICAD